jgi:4'-phosphopantetheinyl transferase
MFSLLEPEWVPARFEDVRLTRSVQYFYFPLPPAAETFVYLRGLLTPEETARADRYVRAADRERSAASRGALRHLLGPGVALTNSPLGRPLAQGDFYPAFNVSHSGSSLLLGFNWERRVGVDVEHFRPGDDEFLLTTMTDRERAVDARLDPVDRQRFRYLLWTRKEAATKAVGLGLHQDPATVDVLDDTTPSGLSLASFMLSGAPASLADEGGGLRDFIRVEW